MARAEELVGRTRRLLPRLRARAEGCETARTLPSSTIEDFRDSGLLRILQPARFGGFELGLDTLVKVVREVSQVCGSSAWCLALYATHNRLVGLFPEPAQREVFGPTGEALLTAVLAPTGTATSVRDGATPGFRVSGRWRFASGCDYADWLAVVARVGHEHATPIPDTRVFLIPAGEFRIEDTWFAAGLRGTGSKDVLVEDRFVPAHRVLSLVDIARGTPPGAAVNPAPLFRLPIIPVLAIAAGGVAIGLALGALHAFREQARLRVGASASGALPVTAPMRLAEAQMSVEAVELLVLHHACRILEGATSGCLTRREQLSYRFVGAHAVAACREATARLFAVSGASALLDTSPIQRAARDLQAASTHALLQAEEAADVLGRVELGLASAAPLI